MESHRETKWDFLPIDKKYQKNSFDCGYPTLNDYLKKYARQNHLKGIAKTFVAVPASGGLKVDGYYTVSASIIESEFLPDSYLGQPSSENLVNYTNHCLTFHIRLSKLNLSAGSKVNCKSGC